MHWVKIAFLVMLFVISPFLDDVLILGQKSQLFLLFMVTVTTLGLLIAVIFLLLFLILENKTKSLSLIILSSALATAAGIILKNIFQVPRPEMDTVTHPLTFAGGFSFPSLHTAYVFSFLPVIERELPRSYQLAWYILALIIAFSRLYLGVHTVVDVSGGILLGYSIGSIILYLEDRFRMIERFFRHIKNKFELRRQLTHMITGITIVILIKLGILTTELLAVILIGGGFISILSRYLDIPGIKELLLYFERDYPKARFAGQGSFFLVLGSFLALIIFPKSVALAAIMIMALGDSINTIVGTHFGKIPFTLNPRRNIEGFLVSVLAATLGAWVFVPLIPAAIASTFTMFIESLDLKIGNWKIDDNLIIPILAGTIMMFF